METTADLALQSTSDARRYRVVWVADLDASSPGDAAGFAEEVLDQTFGDRRATATNLGVVDRETGAVAYFGGLPEDDEAEFGENAVLPEVAMRVAVASSEVLAEVEAVLRRHALAGACS